MPDSLAFSVDVFRTVCDRLLSKAADLQLLVESGDSFEEWLNWEAFLACKFRQEHYPFCEVSPKPTYASEGVATEAGDPDRNLGDLRVGGPNDGADHCWLFAEIVLLHDDSSSEWLKKIEANLEKLKRLGWKKSAALLIVVDARRAEGLANGPLQDRTALTDPFVIPLPGGGKFVVNAFDIKTNRADTLTLTAG